MSVSLESWRGTWQELGATDEGLYHQLVTCWNEEHISFLSRPRLYSTEYFHAALEQRARHNLQRALARLSG